MAFNLADVLSDVSNLDTTREQIEYIKLDLIDADPNNFYQLSGVEQLADNIATCGLQQPIRVRKHPTQDGRYMIVSGHRRREAVLLLAKDDPDHWQEIPCIVERDEISPALQQLRLIYANSNTRTMTSAELSEQAAQVEKLLYQLKEEGYEFPGRMRDHVAQAVNASKTKLARLKVIRDNLASCWNSLWKANKLPESTAYALAQVSKSWQTLIFNGYGDHPEWISEGRAKCYIDRFKKITSIKCAHSSDGKCCNTAEMMQKSSKEQYVDPCSSGCCMDCLSLRTCKNACHRAADKKQSLRDSHKAEVKAEADRVAQRDAPIINVVKTTYERVGAARKAAGVSVADLYKAEQKVYHSSVDDPAQTRLESGAAKYNPNTPLPFGYSFYASNAIALCRVADLLGCSVDYLLGRTEIMEMNMTTPLVSKSDTIWHPISEEPPIGVDLVWLDTDGYSDTAEYKGSGLISSVSTIPWEQARYWAYKPEDK